MSSSYGRILRSSSLMGGAAGLNYVIALFRVKAIAILLGADGVGLISLYMSGLNLIGTVSGLGIGSSGVREIANAKDALELSRKSLVIRRASLVSGALGWLLAIAFAAPLSRYLFGSDEKSHAIALLGSTLLIGAVGGGELAILQGKQRIGEVALVNVLSSAASTIAALGIYAFAGREGVLPVILVTACITTALSVFYARRYEGARLKGLRLRETFREASGLVSLGIALMWSGVLAAILDAVTRSVVSNQFGLQAAGVYQAAWALSGMFAGFILGAMGADYYPRLTAVIGDRERAIQAVNEQTEIGVLMALPGLLATLAFAPFIVSTFYTREFLAGADLLPWMVLGVFGRVISWPMGFILLAKGLAGWVIAAETGFAALQLSLLFTMVARFGLVGVAQAFAISYCVYIFAMFWVNKKVIGFRWSQQTRGLVLCAVGFVLVGFLASRALEPHSAMVLGGVVTAAGGVYCLKGLVERLGPAHRLSKIAGAVPFLSPLFD